MVSFSLRNVIVLPAVLKCFFLTRPSFSEEFEISYFIVTGCLKFHQKNYKFKTSYSKALKIVIEKLIAFYKRVVFFDSEKNCKIRFRIILKTVGCQQKS